MANKRFNGQFNAPHHQNHLPIADTNQLPNADRKGEYNKVVAPVVKAKNLTKYLSKHGLKK